MRAAWTINSIPASQQNHYQSNQQQVQPSTQNMSTKLPEDYISNELVGKHVYWPQNVYFNRKTSAGNEQIQQSHHHQSQMVGSHVNFHKILHFL